MKENVKFGSGVNKDNVRQDVVFERGEKSTPLRRSVGGPAFDNPTEKDEYLKKKELERKIRIGLSEVFARNYAQPSLRLAIRGYLSKDWGISEEKIMLAMEEGSTGFRLGINATEHGDLFFDSRDM